MESSLVFLILLCFFAILMVTEIVSADLAALLGLAFITVLGFISPEEAFYGFGSPAVVTMVAMFITATALQKSGATEAFAKQVCKIIGRNENIVVLVVMLIGAVVSGGMNNVAATSATLPAVMLIAKHTEIAPAKLLMPLTFAVILGGTMTVIGTTPNLLIVDFMKTENIEPFKFLSFTPIGLALTFVGMVFIAGGGYKLLPLRKSGSRLARQGDDLTSLYKLSDRIFTLQVPINSALNGISLEASRFGAIFGAQVLSIRRGERKILYPNPKEIIYAGDLLLVQGRQHKIENLLRFNGIKVSELNILALNKLRNHVSFCELRVKSNSFVNTTLKDLHFREKYNLVVVSIQRNSQEIFAHLAEQEIKTGDLLRVVGTEEAIARLLATDNFQKESQDFRTEHLFLVSLPDNSKLSGSSIVSSKLGEVIGINALAILRADDALFGLSGKEVLKSKDLLIVSGDPNEVERLSTLGDLVLEKSELEYPEESKDMVMAELLLSPRSSAIGKTLVDVNFREKYDYQVLAVWHEGRPKRTNLATRKLELGDALLVHGPINKLSVLKDDSDYVLLSTNLEQHNFSWFKSLVAIFSFLLVTIFSIINVMPVHLVAVVGALLVLLSGALTLEEAYREINWKIVVVIASLLPFGTAFVNSGLADQMSTWLVSNLSSHGFWAGVIVVSLVTSIISQLLDGVVAVLLIAPVALQVSNKLAGNPQLMLMAVAISSSIAFITPFSHKANLLVMGAGGYRASDYARLGVPLTVLAFLALWVGLYLGLI